MSDDERVGAMLRLLLAAAGLDRSEAEVQELLPWFRGRREAAAQLARLDLGDTPMAVGFSADWRDPLTPASSASSGGSQ